MLRFPNTNFKTAKQSIKKSIKTNSKKIKYQQHSILKSPGEGGKSSQPQNTKREKGWNNKASHPQGWRELIRGKLFSAPCQARCASTANVTQNTASPRDLSGGGEESCMKKKRWSLNSLSDALSRCEMRKKKLM